MRVVVSPLAAEIVGAVLFIAGCVLLGWPTGLAVFLLAAGAALLLLGNVRG